MKLRCIRCGSCCEKIYITASPKELREGVMEAGNEQLAEIWQYRGWLGKGFMRRYVYRCRKFARTPTGKGKCLVHKNKPRICERFPFYGEPEPKQDIIPLSCGFSKTE